MREYGVTLTAVMPCVDDARTAFAISSGEIDPVDESSSHSPTDSTTSDGSPAPVSAAVNSSISSGERSDKPRYTHSTRTSACSASRV